MAIRKLLLLSPFVFGLPLLWALGCAPAQTQSVDEAERPSATAADSENEQVAEAVLGKQAEVAAQGDLAHNGSKQLLVVNRVNRPANASANSGDPNAMLVTRAVIVQKDDGRWVEVLRCDERLKNPRGYLAGAPAERVTGWRLSIDQNADNGLELKFAPSVPGGNASSSNSETEGRPISVRWNTKTKRYQSLDQSHKGFLGEVPTLETPQSILK